MEGLGTLRGFEGSILQIRVLLWILGAFATASRAS